MTYNDLCKRLTAVYDHGEAVAVARMVLERAFGLSLTDICCGKVTHLSADESQRLEEMTRRLCSSEPVQYVLGEAVFGGASRILGPRGGLLAAAGAGEEIVTAALDFSVLAEVRNSINVFHDRRPELYRL